MSPHTVTGVQTGWMLDSLKKCQNKGRQPPESRLLTFHQDLFDLLAQLLHDPLGQVMALLGLLKPFIEGRIGPQVGGARSWYC